jgi:PhnB protein
MRFLQIIVPGNMSAPPDPVHLAKVKASIDAVIQSGAMVATGALGKRATSAARLIQKNGEIRVEDPPSGEGWMASGGYLLCDYASKEEAIAAAKQQVLGTMGDAVVELIQVSEVYPPPNRAPQPAGSSLTPGVIPYLTMVDASAAAAFYEQAFAAKVIARMPGPDGKRLMHCHLEINGGALMLSDNFPEMGLPAVQRSSSDTMQLIVSEGDLWWNRAIKAGCTEKLPFNVAPWGDKYGQLTDPFDVTWAINSPAVR